MVENESSKSTMSLASLETSVPVMPIATPTSAFFMAGASFMPSPVTATTLPWALSAFTTRILITGVERAMTRIFFIISENSSSERSSTSLASTAMWSSSKMPSWVAIALAVIMLSPVSIFISMPAWRQRSTAANTSERRGSEMTTKPSNIMPLSTSARSLSKSYPRSKVRWASAITLPACA